MIVEARKPKVADTARSVEGAFPLFMAREGSFVRVVGILGGKTIVRRLYELGIMPGTVMRVVKTMRPGPVIVELAGTRLALGYGMAMKLYVEDAGHERP